MNVLPVLARIIVATLLAGVFTTAARAAVIYDGFDYPPGGEPLDNKNGGAGWSAAWANGCCAESSTTAAGLSFGALAVTPGAATAPAGPLAPDAPRITIYTRDLGTSFGTDNTTLFFSLLLQPEAGAGFYGGINLGVFGGNNFFVGKSGLVPGTNDPVDDYSVEGGGKIARSGVPAVTGTTALLVLRARFHDGSDDILDLYVNPTPGGALPASQATLALTDVGLLTSLFNNSASAWTIDEIRLGSTFAEVTPLASVPAPSALLLLAGGLAGIAAVRWRERA